MSYPTQMKLARWGLLATALLALSQCKKDDNAPQLPLETTTGAETFGCKIDGQVFVPQDGWNKPGMYVMDYVNFGTGRGGGYHLNLGAVDWQAGNSVRLSTDSLLVEAGKTYPFKSGKGNAQADVIYGDASYQKLDNDPGQLVITRFDPAQRILSGTFEFVATAKSTGQQIHVTDGRFDIRF